MVASEGDVCRDGCDRDGDGPDRAQRVRVGEDREEGEDAKQDGPAVAVAEGALDVQATGGVREEEPGEEIERDANAEDGEHDSGDAHDRRSDAESLSDPGAHAGDLAVGGRATEGALAESTEEAVKRRGGGCGGVHVSSVRCGELRGHAGRPLPNPGPTLSGEVLDSPVPRQGPGGTGKTTKPQVPGRGIPAVARKLRCGQGRGRTADLPIFRRRRLCRSAGCW